MATSGRIGRKKLSAILSLIPAEIWIALGGIIASLAAFLFGRVRGGQAESSRRDAETLEAVRRRDRDAQSIREETDEDLVDRLSPPR